ncbi:MAG: Cell division protein FtsI [Peptidoglycan synthetase] (EC [uncultured Campylobacterales bacterium]|uniref:Cell division protein FtsI [Peptidoglycan synthetase] (EC) n=1 Tax=uncultured Campylobacterales bacterium TaxID=352960 RepID=A0A6S6SL24_9BACT|nr:MAG: Cell division protein FtsI [Peptidoglycan synthetase] (EC [uncultured Campylobacterales bacterium]
MKNRLKFVIFFMILVLTILIARLFHISVNKYDYYKQQAYNLTVHSEYIAPIRGMITDRYDNKLAVNKLGFAIYIKPNLRYKSRRDILKREVDFIVDIFDYLDKDKLIKTYLKKDSPYNHNYINIVNFIDYNDMLKNYTKFLSRANIKVKSTSKRFYPYKEVSSHVIGYVGKANNKDIQKNKTSKYTGYIGKNGLEKYYDAYLQDSVGKREIQVNALNIELKELAQTKPKKSNIRSTIDINLQSQISKMFNEENKSGVAIVMDISDGAILAAGSYPEYDLNTFVDGISHEEWNILRNDFDHPFINKIINGKYPPGSVIKMGVAASLLFNNITTKSETKDCNGSINVGKKQRTFRCWKDKKGHEKVDLTKALAQSCDVYFYENSLKLGINNMGKTLKRFGFGEYTGVDLWGESRGILPSRDWKKNRYKESWFMGDTVNTSIGQGYFLVTPLQVAKYMAVLINKKDITPHFIKAIDDEEIIFEQKEIFTKDEKQKLELLKEGMFGVANDKKGTAYWHLLNTPYQIGAKTGTAQVIGIPKDEKERMKEEELTYYHRSHAWMSTYGPFENPKYVVVVLVEHGGHGGSATGNIISNIYKYLDENKLPLLGNE